MFDPSSVTETKNIIVKVEPNFISKERMEYNSPLSADEEKNLFTYEVEIINDSQQWVQLLNRHWIIIDSEGNTQNVKGEGVVGKQPKIMPKTSFSYSSFCPLESEWGTMEGYFTMLKQDTTTFRVKIDRFYLISDGLLDLEPVEELKH